MKITSLISKLRRLVPMVAGVGLLAASAAAQAQNKVALHPNASVGQVWTFDQSTDMTMDQQMSMGGQTQNSTNKGHQHRAGKCEVLAVQNGWPSQMRITFGNDCDNSMETTGQPAQKPPFPLAGQTVTVSMQADGSVSTDFRGQLDQATLSELQKFLEPDASIYPDHEVAVGEEWAGNPQVVAKQFNLQGNDRAGMTMKLLSLKQINGRSVAEVKVSAAVDHADQNSKVEMILQGVALVDVQSGNPLKVTLNGTTTASGSGQAPNGQPVQMKGNGTMTISSSSELVSDGHGGAVPAPAPAVNNGGGNPLAPPAAGADFSGKYTDGNLTLDLQGAGPFTGTITLKQQTYQATATVQNGQLVGSFQVGAASYPFTATLNGDTLTFKTGNNTTYTLKKQSGNPLGQAPQPGNPLGAVQSAIGQPPQASPSGGASAIRLVPYVLKDDPTYIGGEISRVLIPAGWKVEGGIEWDLSNTMFPAQVHTVAYNPHGTESLGVYPNLFYYWSDNPMTQQIMPPGTNYNGSIVHQPVDTVFNAIIQLFIPKYRPDLQNARIVERQELPKLAALLLQQIPQVPGVQQVAFGGRIRFEYELHGQTVQEDVFAVLNAGVCQQMQMVSWSLSNLSSARALKGHVDEAVRIQEIIDRSVQPNIQWFNKYVQFVEARHNVAMDAIQQAGIRSQIITQLSNDISDITRQSFENQQKVEDQIAQARSEQIRDLTPYDDNGKRVVLPNEYQYAWSNGDGSYVATNDPNYDPNKDPNNRGSWNKMSQAAR